MIAVTRETEPEILRSRSAESGRRLCEAHRRHQAGTRTTKPEADSKIYRHAEVVAALERSFQKRCAYCESVLPGKLDVEHFRPEAIYPALAYRWSNLLLACNFCNSHHKGAQFPLMPDGAQPTFDPANPDALDDSDAAMLVDPCRDNPFEHFDWDSEVLLCKTDRATKTREVCGLDRGDLVEERRRHLKNVEDALMGLELASLVPDSEEERHYRKRLEEFSGRVLPPAPTHSEPYSAMVRAYLATRLREDLPELAEEFEL